MNKIQRDVLGWATILGTLGVLYTADYAFKKFSNYKLKSVQKQSVVEKPALKKVEQKDDVDKINTKNRLDTKKTLESVLNNLGINASQKQKETQVYLALIHHESYNFNPFAISSTGAVGLFQLTVETASELRPNIKLYTPDSYFTSANGKFSWKESSLEFRQSYGNNMKDYVKDDIEKKNIASLCSVDKRFDSYLNIKLGVENFHKNLDKIRPYATSEDEAYNIALIAHNRGGTAVMGYLTKGKIGKKFIMDRTGKTTANAILKNLHHDRNILPTKVGEVKNFYAQVSNLMNSYSKGKDPPIGYKH